MKKDFISKIDNLIETNEWIMGDSVKNFESNLKNFLTFFYFILI